MTRTPAASLLAPAALAAALAAPAGCLRSASAPERRDLSACLSELTNLTAFARGPIGTAAMVSTYDRTGGNQDWAQWTSVGPDGLIDLANLDGPGCVGRIWQTHVPAKDWQFFFDGEPEPRLRLTTQELFGGRFPFVKPLSDIVSGGHYSYVPLPYEKSLRIAVAVEKLNPGARPYYHINYETYPKDVSVTSYPDALSSAQDAHVRSVGEAWLTKDDAFTADADRCETVQTFTLEPGTSIPWLYHDGAGILACFWLRINDEEFGSSVARARLLREIVIRLYWDGQEKPSVDVPLGDFFCNAFHRRRFSSAPLGLVGDRYICRFPMPFAKGVRAELRNDGRASVAIEAGSRIEPRPASYPRNYFHASWNASISSGLPFTILDARGSGHYVGCYLNAIGMDGTWTILEGDESFRIDGETIPSIRGTGLEDYFNGAWYYTGLFDLPCHGLLEKAPIRTDQYRLHMADAVPFNTGLQVSIEFGDANRARGYMSGTAYWYQDAPVGVRAVPTPAARRFPPQDPLERVAIMAHLFELERAGLYEEARERCLEYAETYPQPPVSDLLRLRALAYREVTEGYGAVREQYAAWTNAAAGTPAAREAEALMWFHEEPEHALLGLHISGAYVCYLDGQPVDRGDSPAYLRIVRAKLTPGPHSLAVELHPTRPGAYASLYLRTHGTNVTSACAWRYAAERPSGWPEELDSSTAWQDFQSGRAMYPTMNVWQFYPNAFVNMQSGRQLVSVWPDYMREPVYPKAYLRTTFVMPESPPVGETPASTVPVPSAGGKLSGEEEMSRSLDLPGL